MFGKPTKPTPGGEDRTERMQRVRVGLTGLAVVLLIVVVASLLFAQLTHTPIAEQNAANAAAAQKAGDEPLADLGIAPGAPEAPQNQTK